MSKKSVTSSKRRNPQTQLKKITSVGEITEYILTSNGLRVLYIPRIGSNVITTNIVYKVGSRDELCGETGIAHMLEHMLFKPTRHDLKRKTDSGAMKFERETGIILNANTWKDRTSYFFSYPKEHFHRALQIEAERMHDTVLTNAEFKPEQTNVLSEFDMNAGDEHFALSVQMVATALHSHPYGHETIGFREDIASYTVEALNSFYKKYYVTNNATLIVMGDVTEREMKEGVRAHFEKCSASQEPIVRMTANEPMQEGVRTVTVERNSTTNIFALGVKHDGFPTTGWFETMVVFDLLAGGEHSILHKNLVDTGLASQVSTMLEPTYDPNLGILFVTLTKKSSHAEMHTHIQNSIRSITTKSITPYLKKTIAKVLTNEFANRENSLGYTSELVEYVSANAWKSFFDTESKLRSITPTQIKKRIDTLFAENQTTIGYFKGTK